MSEVAVLGALQAVREKIEDPKHWTQGAYARDAVGEQTSSNSPAAVCWCLIGAVHAVLNHTESAIRSDVFGALYAVISNEDRVYGSHLAVFNDIAGRTHGEVLGLLDRAIARLKEIGRE